MPDTFKDSWKRSFFKTLSWRLIGSGSTFAIAYFFSGNLVVSSGIAITQVVANTVLYFMHERLWTHFKFGLHLEK